MVHSFYGSRRPSGENAAVEAEVTALRRAGHDVELVAARTDDRSVEPLYQLRTAFRVATNLGRDPLPEIRRFAPDVVHVHNLFPNFGRRWVTDLTVPLVHTVHNYRPMCAAGTLFRDGSICTLCPDRGHPVPALQYACYRDSRLATLPLVVGQWDGPAGDPLFQRARRIIVLSAQAARLYERVGVDARRMVVWPNFLPDHLDEGPGAGGDGAWLFVGRLSAEKGVRELMASWPSGHRLRIVGTGPLEPEVASTARGDVEFLGGMDRRSVLELMRSSIGLVFPSLCYENFPLVYAESLSCGLPVLALGPNVVTDMVTSEGTGRVGVFGPGLGSAVAEAERDFPDLRSGCRRSFDETYSEKAYLTRANALYDGACSAAWWS